MSGQLISQKIYDQLTEINEDQAEEMLYEMMAHLGREKLNLLRKEATDIINEMDEGNN